MARVAALFLALAVAACGGGGSSGGDGGGGDRDGAVRGDGELGLDGALGPPTLADLFAGRAHFVLDQAEIPMPIAGEGGPSFYGHREIFAVARPDLGDRVVLFYQRCFEPGREANPSICLARSDDDGATMATYLGVIIRPEAHGVTPCSYGTGELFTVAPSVTKLGEQWVLMYEGGGANTCWASSPDGLTWTKQGIMDPGATYDATPGVLVVDDELVVFSGRHRTDTALEIARRRGASVAGLSDPAVVLTSDAPWEAASVSMPRVIAQGGTSYMVYEGASRNLFCGEGAGEQNVYGIGFARSTNLTTWERFEGNPVLQSADAQSCGFDMPQPYLSPYDGTFYLYHPDDLAYQGQRERLAWGSACDASQTPPAFREKNHACLPSCESLGGTCAQTKDCPGGAAELGDSWDCASCCP